MTEPELSYVCGASDVPLRYQTIGEALRHTAQIFPSNTALIVRHQNIRSTYAELDAQVDRLARALIALGLKPGDRLGIWSPNNAEWVLTQFATARMGVILVNINPAYRASELEYVLTKTACRALILATSFKSSDYIAMVRKLIPESEFGCGGRPTSSRFPGLEVLIQVSTSSIKGFLSFQDLYALGDTIAIDTLATIARGLDPDQPINIQFTSGTTGRPKGATLTHFNIVNNGFFIGAGMKLTAQDRLCIPVPLYHCFGMVLGVIAAVTHGATMVFPAEGFDPQAVLESVAAERCTALHGVPTMFIAELEHPRFRDFDLTSLRTGIMSGAPCPLKLMTAVAEAMHMREITICYGMTETSPVSFQSHVDDSFERRVSTVGAVHPHVQVKIVDAEGNVVPRGVSGEILVRGYSVMRGYWGEPERTAEAIDAAGWIHTGDLGVLNTIGECNIVGRVKDMIIRGGENIYPREIEEFFYQHPKVLDVAVVGLPDQRYGEAVCAVFRLRDGENATHEEMVGYCRGEIAHYKVPKYVYFTDSFPLTVTGKIQKYRLREQMQRHFGLVRGKTA